MNTCIGKIKANNIHCKQRIRAPEKSQQRVGNPAPLMDMRNAKITTLFKKKKAREVTATITEEFLYWAYKSHVVGKVCPAIILIHLQKLAKVSHHDRESQCSLQAEISIVDKVFSLHPPQMMPM